MIFRTMWTLVLCLLTATAAEAQITRFGEDVNAAIAEGLQWLDARNVFANPSPAGDAAGLVALALLEKPDSADARTVDWMFPAKLDAPAVLFVLAWPPIPLCAEQ